MRGTRFFLLWFSTVSACIYLGVVLSRPLGDLLYTLNGLEWSASNDGFSETVFSSLFLVGLFMGIGQWLAINTRIKKAYGWILATLIGFGIGNFISFLFFAFISSMIADRYQKVYNGIWMIGTFAGAGIFTGIFQWASLKRKLSDSIKWSCVMALSLAIGSLFLFYLYDSSSKLVASRHVVFLIFSALVGFVSGVFAEPVLIRSKS